MDSGSRIRRSRGGEVKDIPAVGKRQAGRLFGRASVEFCDPIQQNMRSRPQPTTLQPSLSCFIELVAVMLVFFALTHRNHASVCHFALHVLELDCGVVDSEVMMQAVLYVAQDSFAD